MYSMKNWRNDGTFKAVPGQEITAEVYETMKDTVPVKGLPHAMAVKAHDLFNVITHEGFLMGEPVTHRDGEPIYRAFTKSDFTEGPRYYYIGLTAAEKPLNGTYYLFDSMDELADRYLTPDQISATLYTDGRKLTEQDIKNIALDREADLFKYVFEDGERIEKTQLLYLL